MPDLTVVRPIFIALLFLTFAVGDSTRAFGQAEQQPEPHAAEADLATQIAELRTLLLQLETALAEEHEAGAGLPGQIWDGQNSRRGMSAMGTASGSSSMGLSRSNGNMQNRNMGGGMTMLGGMQNMSTMDRMMTMGMSRMGAGSRGGTSSSALPGFPGASHIYHVGATGFFLDHAQRVGLTTDQQRSLNELKEDSLLAQATWERQIDQTEQDLWTLTASDAPVLDEIEAKVRHIERLRGDQRIAFISAVGDAASVLSKQQRLQLVGDASSSKVETDVQPEHEH